MTADEAFKHLREIAPKATIRETMDAIQHSDPALLTGDEDLFWKRAVEYLKRISRKPYIKG